MNGSQGAAVIDWWVIATVALLPFAAWVVFKGLFALADRLADRRRRRRRGVLDLTCLSRSVDQSTRRPLRLYDQEAIEIANELRERAREAQ